MLKLFCFPGLLTVTILLIVPQPMVAQSLKLLHKVPIGKPTAISVDKRRLLYISDEQGNVYQYDTTGQRLLNFSPPRPRDVSLLEAWQSLRIFLFYREYQEYTLLDRFLTPPATQAAYQFNPEQIGFAQVATMAADNNLWVLDNRDFSLKKYDPIREMTLVHTALDLVLDPSNYDINFIREYQNILLINDRQQGILLFDNLGNYQRTLPYPNLNYLGVTQNALCFLQGTNLCFYDLYQGHEYKIKLPQEPEWLFATLVGNRIAALSRNHLFIFEK
ncbi:MAG: hypothetical protein HC880_19655 [Bacteroidia bacterium]|nr:hypothetical protein [Bacteroidia bacterium]